MKFDILAASSALAFLACGHVAAEAALARDIEKKWSKQHLGADVLGTSIAAAGTGFDMGGDGGSNGVDGHLDHIAGAMHAPTMKGHHHRHYAFRADTGHVTAVQDAAVN